MQYNPPTYTELPDIYIPEDRTLHNHGCENLKPETKSSNRFAWTDNKVAELIAVEVQ
jgi:hypothetical protein